MSATADFLYFPADVRAIDAFAIDVLGIEGLSLMERAGSAAYEALRARWPAADVLRIVCGVGSNGGDGFIVARLALEAGLSVKVLQLGDTDRLQGTARLAAQAYLGAGGASEPFRPAQLEEAELIVDAIFGTGLDRPVQGDWARAISAINAAGRPVVALDIPSGLHGATGSALGEAVRADLTVTFIARKAGLHTGAGPAHSGTILLDGLGVPAEACRQATPRARLIADAEVAAALPRRARDAHKGRFGHVLVIGGDQGFGGAARMAAESAARVGAGLVSVATRAEHVAGLLAARPELMVHAIERTDDLQPLLERASVVAIGPGLGQGSWGRNMFDQALRFGGPLVVDADALNLLAQAPRRRDGWILTPHPGEAGRLLGVSPKRIQEDRFAVAEQLVVKYGGVAILKGAGTIVHSDAELPAVCTSGNPGMSSGGMGDVLTGIVAGLVAQGLTALEAATVAVHVHGQAADQVAMQSGERGMLALDLMEPLQRLVNPG